MVEGSERGGGRGRVCVLLLFVYGYYEGSVLQVHVKTLYVATYIRFVIFRMNPHEIPA